MSAGIVAVPQKTFLKSVIKCSCRGLSRPPRPQETPPPPPRITLSLHRLFNYSRELSRGFEGGGGTYKLIINSIYFSCSLLSGEFRCLICSGDNTNLFLVALTTRSFINYNKGWRGVQGMGIISLLTS